MYVKIEKYELERLFQDFKSARTKFNSQWTERDKYGLIAAEEEQFMEQMVDFFRRHGFNLPLKEVNEVPFIPLD